MAEISANGKPRMVATNSQKIRKNTSRNTGFRNAVSAEELSFAEINPILLYTNVCGNVEQEYTRDEIDSQLKTEFISALQPAFGRLTDAEMIKQAQRTAIMRDPTMAAATPVGAQADAMKAAASNEGGAINAGGMNAQNLFAMGQ